jgi:DNA-binding NarL/FixJ family response regulator
MIKLLIVDDEPAVRRGLQLRLAAEPDVRVVGEAANGEAALRLAQTVRPNVVLMDLQMSGMGGIAATKALRAIAPDTAVIILTIHDDVATKADARAAGAAAFISKRGIPDELLAVIRQAVGRPAVTPPPEETAS